MANYKSNMRTVSETSSQPQQERNSHQSDSDDDDDDDGSSETDSSEEEDQEGDSAKHDQDIGVQADLPYTQQTNTDSGLATQFNKNGKSLDKKSEILQKTSHRMLEEENDSSETEESDSDTESSEEDDAQVKSPSKVMVRKVAGRESRTTEGAVDTRTLLQNLKLNPAQSTDFVSSSLNASSFAPSAKSPIMISRVVVPSKLLTTNRPDLEEDTQFTYHSDTDSLGKKLKDRDEEENSDRSESEKPAVKVTKKLTEQKTLQFDDEDEWEDFTPQGPKSHQSAVSQGPLRSEGGESKTRPVERTG